MREFCGDKAGRGEAKERIGGKPCQCFVFGESGGLTYCQSQCPASGRGEYRDLSWVITATKAAPPLSNDIRIITTLTNQVIVQGTYRLRELGNYCSERMPTFWLRMIE